MYSCIHMHACVQTQARQRQYVVVRVHVHWHQSCCYASRNANGTMLCLHAMSTLTHNRFNVQLHAHACMRANSGTPTTICCCAGPCTRAPKLLLRKPQCKRHDALFACNDPCRLTRWCVHVKLHAHWTVCLLCNDACTTMHPDNQFDCVMLHAHSCTPPHGFICEAACMSFSMCTNTRNYLH